MSAERVRFNYEQWGTASSDFDDLTSVTPGVQFHAARSISENYKPAYPSVPDYLAAIDALFLDKEAVACRGDGNALVEFANN